ncbi:hypothetical protein BKH43_01420 [Helicobacter sp. 13S00401-1]|uniref:EI24 domain-containing protein n=1 Tax=Helicobacter sp. 13S00401-1 TaxID=1905758 RepID=UPI000BA58E38|nr:EI24 domain-containing protein [Helicobacter sp. 13S00401-1]PAF51326.1 hypothetical protein BKH43_01420 [Helicobacter sp. 13S00401-1]
MKLFLLKQLLGAGFIGRAFKDFFSKKMLFLNFISFVILIVVYILSFIFLYENFDHLVNLFPQFIVTYMHNSGSFNILTLLLKLIVWIEIILISAFVLVVVNIIMSMFYTPIVISHIHKTYYSHIKISPASFKDSTITSIKVLINTVVKLCILGAIFGLLHFIGLGFISALALLYLFFRFQAINLNYEVALSLMDSTKCKQFLRFNALALFFLNIPLYLLSLVPIVNSLSVAFKSLLIGHYMFSVLDMSTTNNRSDEDVIDVEILS